MTRLWECDDPGNCPGAIDGLGLDELDLLCSKCRRETLVSNLLAVVEDEDEDAQYQILGAAQQVVYCRIKEQERAARERMELNTVEHEQKMDEHWRGVNDDWDIPCSE